MTTTELIELLKKNERGGATGRPREVMFDVDDRIIYTDGIEVTGSGDGLITELYLSLPSAQPKKGKWILIRPDEDKAGNGLYECSECGKGDIHAPEVEVPFCWNCGARMVNEDE